MNRWIAPCVLTLLFACDESCGGAPEEVSAPMELGETQVPTGEHALGEPTETSSDRAPTAEAEVKPPAQAYDADAHRRYRELLAEGRRATRARRYPDAIRALEGACEIDPGDGPALGELGWALFHAGQLDEASIRTQEALAFAYDPTRRAMLLYNMGRIAEASNAPQAAADLYQASLLLRASPPVATRLRACGGVAEFTDETRSLAQWISTSVGTRMDQESPCPDSPPSDDDEDNYEETGECDVDLVDGSSPELQWMLATTMERFGASETVYSLWAQTRGGLYEIGQLAHDWRGMWSGEQLSGSVELNLAQLVVGGPMELVAAAEEAGEDPDWCEGWAGTTRTTTLCGLGAGDVPVCWAHLTTYHLSYTTLGRVVDLMENTEGGDDDEDIARCAVTPARRAAAVVKDGAEGSRARRRIAGSKRCGERRRMTLPADWRSPSSEHHSSRRVG